MISVDGKNALDLAGRRVWVAGHRGMVGSALLRRLEREHCEILTVGHEKLDLTRQRETENWIAAQRPEIVIIAAARVGGIIANATYPADFLYENLMIGTNIMAAAREVGVQKLLWLGSSCVYPRDAAQPIHEDSLLTGPLEATNEAYSVAKIAGIKLAMAYNVQHGCKFITAMPTNLYGPNDNFDPMTAHVLPALIRKIHDAKSSGAPSVMLWGSGRPLREFLHVDDMADACIHLLKFYSEVEPVNIGSGSELSIRDLAELVASILGYQGKFIQDTSKPDGTPRKRLDTSKLDRMGWKPKISLDTGIRALYGEWLAEVLAQQQAEPAVRFS
ncbi:GDP-L-fucose synthase [Mesorhizobium sp. SB112]|uniref:GDP-L-fucose synthase family protein n=1 Tax=Mesorhizobium sp. SB112 TaxID=3151853 RepID=UPI00326699B7